MNLPTQRRGVSETGLSWTALLSVLLFALVVRVMFYSGYFGSDEVTYTQSAFNLLHGDWTVSSYVGANRYGVNLPVAAFALVFGQSEFAAAIYSLLCSVVEVGLVAYFGSRMLGPRAGLMAAVLLASLPVHVHFAGRLMADAPLCLSITASFLLFHAGEARRHNLSYLLAGCAAGLSFWIKPAAIFYLGVFLTYPIIFRRFDLRWGWMILGFAATVLANNVLLWHLSGKFWFVFQNISERHSSGYLDGAVATGSVRNEPYYYLVYLFVKVYHTWIVGFLAVAGAVQWWRQTHEQTPGGSFDRRFTLWWAAGLLLILSLLIVSFSPLTLVPKQTNYMLIFVAPLCLLGGYSLARLKGRVFVAAAAFAIIPALLLSALLQTSVAVFTANSLATVRFSQDQPDAIVYAGSNGYRAGLFHTLVHPEEPRPKIRSISEIASTQPAVGAEAKVPTRFAIIDTETLSWGSAEPYRRLQDVPACWLAKGLLKTEISGFGGWLIQSTIKLLEATPLADSALVANLKKRAVPAPAYVFQVPAVGC